MIKVAHGWLQAFVRREMLVKKCFWANVCCSCLLSLSISLFSNICEQTCATNIRMSKCPSSQIKSCLNNSGCLLRVFWDSSDWVEQCLRCILEIWSIFWEKFKTYVGSRHLVLVAVVVIQGSRVLQRGWHFVVLVLPAGDVTGGTTDLELWRKQSKIRLRPLILKHWWFAKGIMTYRVSQSKCCFQVWQPIALQWQDMFLFSISKKKELSFLFKLSI